MTAIFVYLCFILGLISLVKFPFRLYRFIKSEKKGGFLSGRFRTLNGNSGTSGGNNRTDYRGRPGDGTDGNCFDGNVDNRSGNNGNNNRMSDISDDYDVCVTDGKY